MWAFILGGASQALILIFFPSHTLLYALKGGGWRGRAGLGGKGGLGLPGSAVQTCLSRASEYQLGAARRNRAAWIVSHELHVTQGVILALVDLLVSSGEHSFASANSCDDPTS